MIVITGASGKTGKWAAEELLDRGKPIRVVAREAEHVRHLTQRGAEPAIGDESNVEFLAGAFKNAEAAYLIIPPNLKTFNPRDHYNRIGDAAIAAIKQSGLKKLVFLSSLGAERESGTGPISGLYDVEKKLGALTDVDIVFLRAGFFYENTLAYLEQIRSKSSYSYNADPEAPILMVGAREVGLRAAELLQRQNFFGHSVEELFGDRLTFNEVIGVIGEKLELPSLKYVRITESEAIRNLQGMGMSEAMATSYAELAQGLSRGLITATTLNPRKPNASTRFKKFVEEELAVEYRKAA